MRGGGSGYLFSGISVDLRACTWDWMVWGGRGCNTRVLLGSRRSGLAFKVYHIPHTCFSHLLLQVWTSLDPGAARQRHKCERHLVGLVPLLLALSVRAASSGVGKVWFVSNVAASPPFSLHPIPPSPHHTHTHTLPPPPSPLPPPPTHCPLPSAQYLSLRALRDEMPVEIGTEVRGGQGEGGGGVAVEGEGGMTQALGRARGW